MIKQYRKYMKIMLIVSVLSVGLTGCKSNIEVIKDNLNSNNYAKAAKKVDSLTDETEKEEAENLIKNKIEDIRNEYINGKIDGTLAISDIEKLRSDSDEINKLVDSVSEEINMRMNSKKAFDDGVKFEEEGNYREALESYHLVSEDDTVNYEEAQNRIINIKEKLKREEILSVCEARIIVASQTHKDIYPDQMQIILKNNGSMNIKKFEVTIFGYDENNNPVKIKNKSLENDDYIFLGVADNISINSGDTWGNEYGWSVVNNDINRIEACVEYAEYDDGSIWDNPIYIEWLKEHWVEE